MTQLLFLIYRNFPSLYSVMEDPKVSLLTTEMQSLQTELSIPKDKPMQFLSMLCNGFIKKYETNPEFQINCFSKQLKSIIMQIQVYNQYVYDIVNKYQFLNKLEGYIRGVSQSQSLLLTYLINIVDSILRDKYVYEKKIQELNNKVYERCQNCARPLKKAQIEQIQDQIGLRFRDTYSYFMHDMDQLNKLSEEASLLFRKRILNIDGITQQQYMQKFDKMYENVETSISHITSSLGNISIFQQRMAQIQDNHERIIKNEKQKVNEHIFNTKKYSINLVKYFSIKMSKLQQKLNKIKHYFVAYSSSGIQTDTEEVISKQEVEALRNKVTKLQLQARQIQFYKSMLETQLSDEKSKYKSLEDSFSIVKNDRDKKQERIRVLQVQIEIITKDNQRMIDKHSEKSMENDRMQSTDKIKHGVVNKKVKKGVDEDHRKVSGFISTEIDKQKTKQNLTHKAEDDLIWKKKEQNKNPLSKKYKSPNVENKKEIEVFQPKQFLSKPSPYKILNKIKTQQGTFSRQHITKEVQVQEIKNKDNGGSMNENQSERRVKTQESTEKQRFSQTNHLVTEIQEESGQSERSKVITISERCHLTFNNLFQIKIKGQVTSLRNWIFQCQSFYSHLSNSGLSINKYVGKQEFMKRIKDMISNLQQEKRASFGGKNVKVEEQNSIPNNPTFDEEPGKRYSGVDFMIEKRYQGEGQMLGIRSINSKKQNSDTTRKNKTQVRSKTNTEVNAFDMVEIRKKNGLSDMRKSLNSFDEDIVKPMLKIQILSKNEGSPGKAVLDFLPMLRKKNKERSFKFNCEKIDENIFPDLQALKIEFENLQFTQFDVKTIFISIEKAIEINQNTLKVRKNHVAGLIQEQFFHPFQLSFIKQIFLHLANVHLVNREGYQKIKMFLICPYDSVISQTTQLSLIKCNSSSNTIRESLKNIIILHRPCSRKPEVCKHMKYLLKKLLMFQTTNFDNKL